MISTDSFVHMHLHSDASNLDGVAKADQIAQKAKKEGHIGCAITDHGTLSGVVPFYKACKSAGIKPLLGCEFYLAFSVEDGAHLVKEQTDQAKTTKKNYNHLTVIAKNKAGWKNLSRLASIASLHGFYYKPRIDLGLLRKYHEGLVVLSGCLSGPVSIPLVQGNYEEAKQMASRYKEIFGPDYYGEIQHNSIEKQKRVNDGWLRLSKELDIKLVASADTHYIEKEDATTQDLRICVASGKKMLDAKRLHMTPEYYYKSTEEMSQFFGHMPEVILQSRLIADQVEDYSILSEGKYFLPKLPLPEDCASSLDYLNQLARVGLEKKIISKNKSNLTEYQARLDYEMSVITDMELADYFLIVHDLITWSRAHGMSIGPGRGSAAGSLLCYLIGITEIDPIPYGLFFERFLNPGRKGSLPDIDIDIADEDRWKAVEYLRHQYGRDNVCQIITLNTFKPRMALRDSGRAMGYPLNDMNNITKMVPERPNMTFEDAFKESPALAELAADPVYQLLFEQASKLEGVVRHTGIHAAGLVISDLPLMERIPLAMPAEGTIVTQFPMEEVEEVGLLKMDLLGLKTLTVIQHCLKNIRKSRGRSFKITDIPLNDPRTFRLLQTGESMGVFQLESTGMRKVLSELQPDRIEDIFALVALYRPGPLESGMVQSFIDRKHGRETVTYEHPVLQPILSNTYGTLVYQEQIMSIAHQLAGFSLADADGIRKAIGKKKLDVMLKYKERFIEGAQKHSGFPAEKAEKLWRDIELFSGYSFNRSHSAAYGTLSYRTAYLKANYPVEFMAAYLTSIRDDSEKLGLFIQECRQIGIRVTAPDINHSVPLFEVRREKNGQPYIQYGFEGVKGCAETAAEGIVAARSKVGEFRTLRHFCETIDSRVDRGAIGQLVRAGAFDCLHPNNREVMYGLVRGKKDRENNDKKDTNEKIGNDDTGREEVDEEDAENKNSIEEGERDTEEEEIENDDDNKESWTQGRPDWNELLQKKKSPKKPILPDLLEQIAKSREQVGNQQLYDLLDGDLEKYEHAQMESYREGTPFDQSFYQQAEEVSLGFSLLYNVLENNKLLINRVATAKLSSAPSRLGQRLIVAGQLVDVHSFRDKSGNEMAFFKITDRKATLSCIAFHSVWEQFKHEILIAKSLSAVGLCLVVKVEQGRDGEPLLRVIQGASFDQVKRGEVFRSVLEVSFLRSEQTLKMLAEARQIALKPKMEGGSNSVLVRPTVKFVARVFDEINGHVINILNFPLVHDDFQQELLKILPAGAKIRNGVAVQKICRR